ncbi:Transporter [Candidatus Terasakiella magnetica]|uniref:glutathione-specific gamma-glutamylcyclotransferase n=1 Tax=Candidatus Terasakiella magnetica TaxID=1867952 RepID=A0A1C3RM32_9PROT|nr:gamma-glutamylcyclotransferase [Candidatus Terasakiella magnetica]SCA58322.1 Transporter [Candidatus Terasakiella magnetica]
MMGETKEKWVFAYGSLMWHPGFEYLEVSQARLSGYHRDLCILSYVFRGTRALPGLVMGLNPTGQCIGRAFLVAEENWAETHAYLDEREMINQVYEPSWVEIELEDGRQVEAYTFIAVQGHDQHVGHFSLDEKVDHVLQGVGQGGSALEYVQNTCRHLQEIGITDSTLEAILQAAVAKKGSK